MNAATVLVLGGGGREHALAWGLARSPEVGQVYVAPGNAGTEWPAAPGIAPSANAALELGAPAELVAFARERRVDLTVVGPEALLAAGVADAFQAAGLPVFGPTRAAARLETSKAFAKEFMRTHGIPTGDYAAFDDYAAACRFLDERARMPAAPSALVVKADGLAAGKGVTVCATLEEARAALDTIMQARAFGAAGDTVLFEERLSGREVSLLAFCDGKTAVAMPPARDHKRVYDGDQGPNTGGMGAYAPAPDISAAWVDMLMEQVILPTVTGMAAQGTPYVGVLYAGLMLTPDGPRTLEFNCRFGDPEAQAILPLLATSPVPGRPDPGASLFAILVACAAGRLDQVAVRWQPGACATIVLASSGYPRTYPTGLPIRGLDQFAEQEHVVIFHAGTARRGAELVTAGGRVLAVSAVGPDLTGALSRAYNSVRMITFEGMHYRHDIGG